MKHKHSASSGTDGDDNMSVTNTEDVPISVTTHKHGPQEGFEAIVANSTCFVNLLVCVFISGCSYAVANLCVVYHQIDTLVIVFAADILSNPTVVW